MAIFTIPYPATGLTMYAGIYDSSGSIWDGEAYVTLASLNDITAWQDLLYEALELELDDATGASIYQTEDIAVTGYDEVVFYSGDPPATYNAVASLSVDTITTLNGALGSGGNTFTVITQDTSSNPLAGVLVWVTSDQAGATVIAGTLISDALGGVTFMLPTGTAWLWRMSSGYTFPNSKLITISSVLTSITFADGYATYSPLTTWDCDDSIYRED